MKRSFIALTFCLLSLVSFAQNPKDVLYSCYKTAFVDQLESKPYFSAMVSAVRSTFRMDNATMQDIMTKSSKSDTVAIRSVVTELTEHLLDDEFLLAINKEYAASMLPVMQTYVDITCPVITTQMTAYADLYPVEKANKLASVAEMAATLAQSDPVMIRSIQEYAGNYGNERALVMSKVIAGYVHMKCRYMRDDLIDIMVSTAFQEYFSSISSANYYMQEDVTAYILTGSADTIKKYFRDDSKLRGFIKDIEPLRKRAKSLKLGKFDIWHIGGAMTLDGTSMYFAGNISKPEVLGGLRLKVQLDRGKLLFKDTEFIPINKVPDHEVLLNMASNDEKPPTVDFLPDTK